MSTMRATFDEVNTEDQKTYTDRREKKRGARASFIANTSVRVFQASHDFVASDVVILR